MAYLFFCLLFLHSPRQFVLGDYFILLSVIRYPLSVIRYHCIDIKGLYA